MNSDNPSAADVVAILLRLQSENLLTRDQTLASSKFIDTYDPTKLSGIHWIKYIVEHDVSMHSSSLTAMEVLNNWMKHAEKTLGGKTGNKE